MATATQQDAARIVGGRVRSLRTDRGWSQERLGRETELSRETIRRAEAATAMPEWSTLDRIARAFGMSLADLLGLGSAMGRFLLDAA